MKKLLLALAVTLSACQTTNMAQHSQPSKLILPVAEKTVGSIEIYDDEALKYISPDTKISIRGEGFTWVEGPSWVEAGQFLLFSDIPNNRIMKYEPQVGVSLYMNNPGYLTFDSTHNGGGSNGLLINSKGQLVLMQQGARQIAIMDAPVTAPEHKFITQASHLGSLRLNSPNDLVEHSSGSLYFTDPTYGLNDTNPDRKQQLAFSGVYKLDNDGLLTVLDKAITFPNGIGLSPNEKTLYVAVSDKNDAHWLAYDVNQQGTLINKRRFHDANHLANSKGNKGMPDGMAIHSSGVLFATGPGGVWLLDPKGQLLARILTGQNTSNCTLTTNEDYLFITADDFIMSVPIRSI